MIRKNVPIGALLKEKGYITEDQIQNALAYQKEHKGVKLGEALIALSYVTEKQMLLALCEKLQAPYLDVSQQYVSVEAVELVPKALAQKYILLPISIQGNILSIIINDPLNYYALEDIRQLTGYMIDVGVCEKEPLSKAIEYYYSEIDAKKAVSKANNTIIDSEEDILNAVEDEDEDAPIIRLLDTLVQRGNATGASDIHIEPFEKNTIVRYRVDGMMVEGVTLEKQIHASLITRIKIVGNLDIAEKRIPQDGHFRMEINGRKINLRVSVIPTVYGEKAVMRLLSEQGSIDHRGTYGMTEENFNKFQKMLKSPNGIIYLTGPTGSGKTTTLYMALEEFVKNPINISTIEDPVEKNIQGINQMQVNNQAGLTFERGLRALLRQDPDIIMVGETRDAETASISVRAAITGHLVFSTLHTNSAIDSIVRLQDMGLEPYMVANSVVGVVAQRLVRKVCPECCKTRPTTEVERKMLGDDCMEIREAVGCHQCNGTGYHGRIGIHEMLLIDKKVRKMIANRESIDDITDYAINEQGMITLKEGAVDLVREGITTMEELHKVAYYSD
jgi:type IV pilus assembly protein PilB